MKPFWAHVDVHCATVIESLAVLNPVSARAPPSDTQPEAVQPEGGAARTLLPVGVAALTVELTAALEAAAALELETAAMEVTAAALELVALAESTDVVATEDV